MKMPSDPLTDNVVDDAADDAVDNFADDTASPVAVALRSVPLTRWVDLLSVCGGVWFVLWVVNPDGVLFIRSMPTGGDLGAHVWGPAFLRDELLPQFRLTGWRPDW